MFPVFLCYLRFVDLFSVGKGGFLLLVLVNLLMNIGLRSLFVSLGHGQRQFYTALRRLTVFVFFRNGSGQGQNNQ